jgi:hypothetical protein
VLRVSVVAGSLDQLHQIRDQDAAQLQANVSPGGGAVTTAIVSGVGDEAAVETVQVTLNGRCSPTGSKCSSSKPAAPSV